MLSILREVYQFAVKPCNFYFLLSILREVYQFEVKPCNFYFLLSILREVYQFEVNLQPMEKILTPYGGRLVFTMPGENKLIVHLKDKEKIRHRKRWSQVWFLKTQIILVNMEELILSVLSANFFNYIVRVVFPWWRK